MNEHCDDVNVLVSSFGTDNQSRPPKLLISLNLAWLFHKSSKPYIFEFMIRFQIPKNFMPGFEALLSIGSESVKELCAFLNEVPVGTGPKAFGTFFEDRFNKKDQFPLSLASFLFSLGSFNPASLKSPVIDLAKGLASSYNDQRENSLAAEEMAILEDKLHELLKSNGNLTASFKAFELMSENEIVLRDSHIITDIRLIFKENITENSRYGLVKHQLKFEVEESNDQIDYYFNLTLSDLNKLKEQIDRAIEKENLIRKDYSGQISFISITE